MSEGESVKVAVRVRPFNGREKDRNAKLIIQMIDKMTIITNPSNEEEKKFSFDFSYWSHDGFETQDNGLMVPVSEKYHDQRYVFDGLGKDVLDNAFKGFNCSLFAYGQTGSGKSYSMVGYGVNLGIVPISCAEIFKHIDENPSPDTVQMHVSLSMLEIYNEAVQDLLVDNFVKGGLKVRQHPKLGVQVVDLSECIVKSYEEIEKRIADGTSNRTVAATNMNATSSRAHTVVAIKYTKIEIDGRGPGKNREITSKINLVDLAGSERAESTGATGDRLKEGAAINLSLTMLGNVIKALAERSNNPKSKILIPYRDSKLTQILQDALGGNSKTIMIAALSPADINYEETLSTLRYADRAKQIKNKAIINVDPTELLIGKLKEENARLMAQLKAFTEGGNFDLSALQAAMGGEGGAAPSGPMSEEDKERLKKQLQEEMAAEIAANAAMLEEQAKGWEERYKEGLSKYEELDKQKADEEKRMAETPHMRNINEDPSLSNMVNRFFDKPVTTVGRKDAVPAPDIALSGLSIAKEHAVIKVDGNKVTIESLNKSKVMVRGKQITEVTELHHHDRIMFGASHLYYFVHPHDTKEKQEEEQTWEAAQEEIARAQGFAPEKKSFANLTQAEAEQMLIQEEIVKILPLVNEANDIAAELSRPIDFEVKMINKLVNGRYRAEVSVLVKNAATGGEWVWDSKKFTNRAFLVRELYQKWMEDPDVLKSLKEDEDPFWDPAEPVVIGTATVYLSPLAFLLDFEDQVDFRNYKGESAGVLDVKIFPCQKDGTPIDEENTAMPDDAKDLLGRELFFNFTIGQARGIDPKFKKGIQCKFLFFNKMHETKLVSGSTQPDFAFSDITHVQKIDAEMIKYLENGHVSIEVWGEQDDKANPSAAAALQKRRGSIHPATLQKMMSDRDSALDKALEYIDKLHKEKKMNDEDAAVLKGHINMAKLAQDAANTTTPTTPKAGGSLLAIPE